jgi:hypothetical protein
VTPHIEAWQAVVWHVIVSHPVRGRGQGSRSERLQGRLSGCSPGGWKCDLDLASIWKGK